MTSRAPLQRIRVNHRLAADLSGEAHRAESEALVASGAAEGG